MQQTQYVLVYINFLIKPNTNFASFFTFSQTVSAVYAFFLAMTLHPTVAEKAQAELDSVVGNERLPSFGDRNELPYLNALVKEVFRWNTVAPLGKSFLLLALY